MASQGRRGPSPTSLGLVLHIHSCPLATAPQVLATFVASEGQRAEGEELLAGHRRQAIRSMTQVDTVCVVSASGFWILFQSLEGGALPQGPAGRQTSGLSTSRTQKEHPHIHSPQNTPQCTL